MYSQHFMSIKGKLNDDEFSSVSVVTGIDYSFTEWRLQENGYEICYRILDSVIQRQWRNPTLHTHSVSPTKR